jgi:hypothetical protein
MRGGGGCHRRQTIPLLFIDAILALLSTVRYPGSNAAVAARDHTVIRRLPMR